jgi:hypothetical protein
VRLRTLYCLRRKESGIVLAEARAEKQMDIPVNIEFEYEGDSLVEVPKCFPFVKEVLA